MSSTPPAVRRAQSAGPELESGGDSDRTSTLADLAPIEMPLQPDVGVEVSAPTWQDVWGVRAEVKMTSAVPFQVTGPDHVVEFIRTHAAEGASTDGIISPPNKITITGQRAKDAGIPPQARFYAFAYPMECLTGKYDELTEDGNATAEASGWLYFLLVGGYCYFDEHRRLLQTNAFVMTPTERKLDFAGPFLPAADAIQVLRDAQRLRNVTLAPLLAQGFRHFAWLNPSERPGGKPLLADGGDLTNNGAFLYEMESGESVVFSLINKKTFGFDEGRGRMSSIVDIAVEARNSSAQNIEGGAEKWRLKAMMSRAKTFIYKPAVQFLPDEKDLPDEFDPSNYKNMEAYEVSDMGREATRDSLRKASKELTGASPPQVTKPKGLEAETRAKMSATLGGMQTNARAKQGSSKQTETRAPQASAKESPNEPPPASPKASPKASGEPSAAKRGNVMVRRASPANASPKPSPKASPRSANASKPSPGAAGRQAQQQTPLASPKPPATPTAAVRTPGEGASGSRSTSSPTSEKLTPAPSSAATFREVASSVPSPAIVRGPIDQEVAQLREEVAQLRSENATLRTRFDALFARVQKLEQASAPSANGPPVAAPAEAGSSNASGWWKL